MDMITPAPRDNGAAISRWPTCPSFTRTYSSSPIGESSFLVIVALTVGLAGGASPWSRYSSGLTNSSLVRMAETG